MDKHALAKKRGKNFCDELWGKLVRLEFKNKCPICESFGLPTEDKLLNSHHLISRRVYKYRWDVDNGLLVCPKHHEFDLYISAHTAPWGFEKWVQDNLPIRYVKWVENRKILSEGDNPVYKYEEIYHQLEKSSFNSTGRV